MNNDNLFNPLGFTPKRVKKTKRNQRNVSFDAKIKSYLEDKQIDQDLVKDEDLLDQQKQADKLIESFKNESKSNKRQQRRMEYQAKDMIREELMYNFLVETTVKSLVLDESFINLNKEYLRHSIKKVYKEAFADYDKIETLFTESDSQLMNLVPVVMKEQADKLFDARSDVNIFSEEILYSILESDEVENSEVGQTAEEIAEIVKEKVVDTLENEKEIAEQNAEENESEKAKEGEKENPEVEEEIDPKEPSDEDLGTMKDESDDEDSEDDEDIEETDDMVASNSDNEEQTIIIKTDSKNFTVTSKSGSDEIDTDKEEIVEGPSDAIVEGLTLVSKTKGKRFKNQQTLFRSLMESNISKLALNESSNGKINMDMILAETILNYTMLETLNTARLVNIKPTTVKNMELKLRLNNTLK